eukprot:2345726-Amphidinium_carterae.1
MGTVPEQLFGRTAWAKTGPASSQTDNVDAGETKSPLNLEDVARQRSGTVVCKTNDVTPPAAV